MQLLWREEALSILEELGNDPGVRSKPRKYLWHRLISSVPPDALRERVRSALKARVGWRSDHLPTRHDAMFQLSST